MPPKQKNKPLSNQKSFKDLLTSYVHSQHTSPKTLKLSIALKENSHEQVSNSKISLVQKGITQIDLLTPQLSTPFNKITKLYLSNNHILSLENIRQFSQLQILSLTNNHLTQLPTLRNLTPLQHLTNLALQGNPICKQISYTPYVCGVTQGRLKIFDHQQVSSATIVNGMQCWTVYEDSMKELLVNYFKLMHLLKIYKWQQIHNTIRKAGDHFQNKNEPQINPFAYLNEVDQGIQFLPISFLISIESILYRDIEALSESQTKGYEGVAVAMYRLISKQQDKIDELIDQIKGSKEICEKEQVEDVVFMMEGVRSGKSRQRLYAEWKLLKKCFAKLKLFTEKNNAKNEAGIKLSTFLNNKLLQNFYFMKQKIFVHSKYKSLLKISTLCYKKVRQSLENGFSSIAEFGQISYSLKELEIKKSERKWKKQIFFSWKKETKFSLLQAKNQSLATQLEEQKQKELKYLNKIQLLEQLLDIMEKNQKQETSPLDLLTDIPPSLNSTEQRSPKYGSPCGKAIRKNVGKENMVNEQNCFVQRKFNSSRKTLKLNKDTLF